ncbi:MAG TPA: efflux transporter outer membrane subunit [Gammaproteobacteria bacterium]
MKRSIIFAAAVLLTACSTAPFMRPHTDLPAAWRSPAATGTALADRPWGELFQAAEIQTLIRSALEQNADLRIAAERVELARAQYGIQRSNLYPNVLGDAAYTRSRQPSIASATENRTGETASIGLAMPVWEIDLWGRLRAQNEAAWRSVLASEENRRFLYVSLIAQVVLAYLDLMEADAQLEIARRTAQTRRESLRLVRLRFDNGIVSAVDLQQAESLLAGAEVTIADLQRRQVQGENFLSVLIGRNPGPIARALKLSDYALPPELPAGMPAQLIERRQDVRAAEQTLAASQANVDAAKKAYLPAISLTGFLGVISPELEDLFDSGRDAWSVSPALTAPIFTAGRLASNVEFAEAQQRIAAEQYRQAIRNALREVEDALVAYQRLREQRDALERVVAADRERLRLTRMRYEGGVSSYFEVLDSERQYFSSELSLVQTTRAAYASVVQLYRALGGGWSPDAENAALDSGALWSGRTRGTGIDA